MRNISSVRVATNSSNSRFRPRSLRSRVTLLTLAMVVVSIWSLALYAERVLREDMQQQLGAQQFATVSLVAAGINEQMALRLGALETVGADITPGMLANPVAMQALMVQRPLLQNLFNAGSFVTRADGTAIASLPISYVRVGFNYKDRDYIIVPTTEAKSVISKPVFGRAVKAPIFAMSVPIRDAKGKVIGVLVGVTDLTKPNFLDQIAAGRYGVAGGYLLIAPQYKLFVTATDKSRILQPIPAPGINQIHDRYMLGYEGYGLATSSRGVTEVSAAKRIPAAGWFLVAVLPADEAFAPIQAMQDHLLIAMLFLTVLAGGLTWWMTSWMLRRQLSPILAAERALTARSDSDKLLLPLPVARQDEIGELIGGFNRLLETLGQREKELRESEALFRAVSESAHDAIVTADGSGKIIKWNPSAGQMFGYSETEAIGQSLTLLMPGRFRDLHNAGISRVSAGGEPRVLGRPVQLVGLRKDGSEFPMDLSLAQWHVAEGHFFTGVIRDITLRKQVEQELEDQRAHLEELVETRTIELTKALDVAKVADQTKDAFLANMSHELRTPLSGVIGIANLAQGISTDPKLRDYLSKIVRSGNHLNRIINELLDLSKIAAGRMEFEIVYFSLRKVIDHVESAMTQRATDKGLAIVRTIDAAVPDVLRGDPTRVEQIFLNLLGNAIKFTHAGGIEIRVRLQAREESRVCLEIEFEDSGIGMRPEDLEQLFKPFTQADATVSRKYGGTGLGLTISRRLAEMMDGDISVASIKGSGTIFKVRIWLGLGKADDLPTIDLLADDALSIRYQGVRVLVADDQALNREIAEALLAVVGITPSIAENGKQALDILRDAGPGAFDLVLMDIQMPIMDGLTTTRTLRSLAGFESLPIIAMTAHTMVHEQELNATAGMNDHIGKPFDNASFYRTLAKWIPEAKKSVAHESADFAGKQRSLTEDGNELTTLRDVDAAAALARFGGNEVRYRHWLADFLATAGAVPGQIRTEIAAGRSDTAARTAHAFKGRVGMLGMSEIHSTVSALELVLQEGSPAEDLLATLERSINQMCDELARVVNPGTADTTTAKPILEGVVWNDRYSVGVAEMDDQHKKLVGMINSLADCDAGRSSGSTGAFHEVLSHMFDYTQLHFKAEEDYLHRIGYPRLTDQKAEHAAFVGKMAAFSMAAAEGVQDEAAVHRYLKAWLLSHILESDMQYRSFVESK